MKYNIYSMTMSPITASLLWQHYQLWLAEFLWLRLIVEGKSKAWSIYISYTPSLIA